jgi:hypothetical protein
VGRGDLCVPPYGKGEPVEALEEEEDDDEEEDGRGGR